MAWTLMAAAFRLLGGLRGLLSAVIGAGLAMAVFLAWNAAWDNPHVFASGKAAGAAEERIVWEEARRKLIAQMTTKQREAQAAIDAIELEYLSRRGSDERAIKELEDEIARIREADTYSGDRCTIAIPRGLSNKLDSVGR